MGECMMGIYGSLYDGIGTLFRVFGWLFAVTSILFYLFSANTSSVIAKRIRLILTYLGGGVAVFLSYGWLRYLLISAYPSVITDESHLNPAGPKTRIASLYVFLAFRRALPGEQACLRWGGKEPRWRILRHALSLP